MGIPFDVVWQDLADAPPALLYQDRNHQVFLDQDRGFLASVGRFFYRILGVREYSLEKIVNCYSTVQRAQGSKIEKNLEFLCGKIAKGCGIDNETYEKVLAAEKLFYQVPNDTEKKASETFLTLLSENQPLQQKLESFQAKLGSELPEARHLQSVLERVQLMSRWTELGLDPALFNNDYEGAKFLIQNRLIYSILGFQNSTQNGASNHEIKIDSENRMMIKKERNYVVISELAKEMTYDKERDELETNEKPGEYWNYFSPNGLVPVDRWLHEEFIPIEQLSFQEMEQLRAHANDFFPEGKAPHSDVPRDAVIQIFTNPRQEIPFEDFPLVSRLSASFPMHASIRIITNDGKVYSTGFGADVEEYSYREKEILATVNGMPTILDFEEFRKHEGRVVTTIPVTSKACDEVLNTFCEYRKKTVRFNLATQNCVQLAVDTLDQTGVKVNALVTGPEFIGALSPASEALPGIGEHIGELKRKIIDITNGEFGTMPRELLIGARLVQAVFLVGQSARDIIDYIPSKLVTLFCNVMVFALGGATGSPLPSDRNEGAAVLEQDPALRRFSSIIRNPLDLFKEDTSTLYHALPLVQWQMQQRSTAIHPYGKQPAMGILPPAMTPEIEEKKKYLVKKYLTNFGLV